MSAMTDTFENIEFTYDSQKRISPAVEELLSTILYKDLIYQLIRRDIVARYKRSVLGVFWTMLQPLGMMIVMSIVFSQLFGRIEGYIAYLLSGLVAWSFFSQTTASALHQIITSSIIIKRIYIPKTSFSISAIGTGLVNLILSLVPLILIMFIIRRPITWSFLFLPISILLLAAFSLGTCLILSTLAIQFPDIKEMYQIILQAWMYLTPIMYPEDIIPATYRHLVLYLNPMYYLIELFRSPIYNGNLPSTDIIFSGSAISLTTLVIGWIYYSYQSGKFAYLA
jgi:ABC-type polysaccharide/polyol phosphate export permease